MNKDRVRREKTEEEPGSAKTFLYCEKWDVTAHSQDIKDNFEAMGRPGSFVAGVVSSCVWKASFSSISRINRAGSRYM